LTSITQAVRVNRPYLKLGRAFVLRMWEERTSSFTCFDCTPVVANPTTIAQRFNAGLLSRRPLANLFTQRWNAGLFSSWHRSHRRHIRLRMVAALKPLPLCRALR